jgi:hypothetical protein
MSNGAEGVPDDFPSILRAGRIVAPISDHLESHYFEGAILHILCMLGECDIEVKAEVDPPDPPFEVPSRPLTREWFASILRIRSGADYPQLVNWNRAFLAWARSELKVSRAGIIAHIGPPSGRFHAPVRHLDQAGVSWSFPQVLAWIATRDPLEVARIQYGEHFGPPISGHPWSPLQNDNGRRLLIGWLVLRTSLDHCKCGSRATFEREKWETCECVGKAHDALISYGSSASKIMPRYLPEPQYASFTLTWPESAHSLAWQRSDILINWPADGREIVGRPTNSSRGRQRRSKLPPDDEIEVQLLKMREGGMRRDAVTKRIREVAGFEGVGNQHARDILSGKLKRGRPPKK